MAAAATLDTPSRLGHYEVHSPLGRGGMGEVYLATDRRLGRKIALKVLPPELASSRERLQSFKYEARAVAALEHPNIVTIFSIEEIEGLHFLTLELIRGHALDEIMEAEAPLEPGRVLDLARPLCDAVGAVHAGGLVHGDLKPANVMLAGSGVLKVLDFGLATAYSAAEVEGGSEDETVVDATATAVAEVAGTLPYMAPERLGGQRLTPLIDVYALGVLLYEMCSGRRPFRADGGAELVAEILRDPFVPLDEVRPSLWPSLRALVHRCLSRVPEARPADAGELERALAKVQREATGEVRVSRGAGDEPSTTSGFLTAEGRSAPSIVVLPFLDLSQAKDQEFFCDGLTEDLISALTRFPGLRVVARTSAFSFKDQQQDVREIGRALGVGRVLQGSVRRAGPRLRVTVQLVSANDGFQLWSERFDRLVDDIFAIQDEITEEVVEMLQGELASGEQRAALSVARQAPDLDAYHHYLKARYLWNKRSATDIERAIAELRHAVDIDPTYALAHAGVADCYTILGYYSRMTPDEAFPRAKAAARRALEIDPELAEAHASIAFCRTLFDWDWRSAEASFRRALELRPGYATLRHWYSEFLVWRGQADEAVREAKRALELDPLSLIINTLVGWVYYYSAQNRRAIRRLEKTLELDPDFSPACFWLALAHAQEGHPKRAVASLERVVEKEPENLMMQAALGSLYAGLGCRAEADLIAGRLEAAAAESYVPPYYLAALFHGYRETERTFAELERAFEVRDNWLVFLGVDPLWNGLRQDPRFQVLLRRVGLASTRQSRSI